MRKHKLLSGKELRIQPARFRQSKHLFDMIAQEIKSLRFDPKAEFDINFVKDTALGLVASEKVEQAIIACMENCLYENQKVNVELFEDNEARQDYLEICFEIAKENALPFTKNLSSKFEPILKDLGLSLQLS